MDEQLQYDKEELEAEPEPEKEKEKPCKAEKEKACKPNVLVYLRKGGVLSKSLPCTSRRDASPSKTRYDKLPKCDYEYKTKPTDTPSKGTCKPKTKECPPLKPKSKPVEIPILPTNYNYKETPTCSKYIQKEITSFKDSQSCTSEINLEGVEIFDPLDADVSGLTSREYVEKFVMPTVNVMLQDLLIERPPNPIKYMVKHLQKKYACHEPANHPTVAEGEKAPEMEEEQDDK